MKKITAVLGTLIIVLSANTSFARSLHPLTYVLTANIESMNIDQESYLNDMRIYGGKILIKQLKREITLQFEYAPECPAGMVCPMVLRAHEITLPLKSQYTDRCGTTIYVTERNMMPADGTHDVIKVADNTTNICPTFVALPETSAIFTSTYYDRINGGTVSTHSTFEADKLEGRVLPTNDLPKVLPALQ
jgi:hypothetical protein